LEREVFVLLLFEILYRKDKSNMKKDDAEKKTLQVEKSICTKLADEDIE
jgi:hypothetical protein